jgi:ribosome recycling factor
MAASFMAGLPALKETFSQLKVRMEKAVEDFRQHLVGTRTGRASVHMLDNVRVPYYGSDMPLNQVAQVSAPEANLIVIQPFDPSLLPDLEKALRTSELGFNPQNDGKIIRLPIPPMTEERRKDVVKQLNKQLEEHRTAIRNIRRDGNDAIKKAAKDKKISEDEEKRSLEEIQKLTDDEIKRIEEMCRAKEKDVMQV